MGMGVGGGGTGRRWRLDYVIVGLLVGILLVQVALLLNLRTTTTTTTPAQSQTAGAQAPPPPAAPPRPAPSPARGQAGRRKARRGAPSVRQKLDVLLRFVETCAPEALFHHSDTDPEGLGGAGDSDHQAFRSVRSLRARRWAVLDEDVMGVVATAGAPQRGLARLAARLDGPAGTDDVHLGLLFEEGMDLGRLAPRLAGDRQDLLFVGQDVLDRCPAVPVDAALKRHKTFQYVGAYQEEAAGIAQLRQAVLGLAGRASGGTELAGNKTSPLLWARYSMGHTVVRVVVSLVYPRQAYHWWAWPHRPRPVLLGRKPGFAPTALPGRDVTVLQPAEVSELHYLAQARAGLLECDFQRAARFRGEHGAEDQSGTAMRFRQQAKALLIAARTALNAIGVPFWIGSGTLLGWYRQCNFIAYSKDVDFGVFIDDYRPELIDVMRAHGLRLTHRFGSPSDSFELSFKTDKGIKLDIFFFYKDTEAYWNGGTQARTGRKFKYLFPPFGLCWAVFLGITVRVPCNTQEYIEANYGSNWFTPVEKWDWKSSPPNVRGNGAWPKRLWPKVIQCDVCPNKVRRGWP